MNEDINEQLDLINEIESITLSEIDAWYESFLRELQLTEEP